MPPVGPTGPTSGPGVNPGEAMRQQLLDEQGAQNVVTMIVDVRSISSTSRSEINLQLRGESKKLRIMSTTRGDTTVFTMGPAPDVTEISRRIQFGEVTEVDLGSRMIYVKLADRFR